MYINDDRTAKTVKFATLCEGDVFYDDSEDVYCMVIEPCTIQNYREEYRAVNIRNGKLFYYSDNDDVEPVTAHVRITNS